MPNLEGFRSTIKEATSTVTKIVDRLRSKPEAISAEEFANLSLDQQGIVLSKQMIWKMPRIRWNSLRIGGVQTTPNIGPTSPPAFIRHARVESEDEILQVVTVQDRNEKIGELLLIFPEEAFQQAFQGEITADALQRDHCLFITTPDSHSRDEEFFEPYGLYKGFTEDSAKKCLEEVYLRLTADEQQKISDKPEDRE